MRRLLLLTIAGLLSSGVSLCAAASIGSTAREFRTEFGRPSFEEHLVRTATLRWKPLRSREPSLAVAKASAFSVSLLDGHAAEVTIWCERPLSNADTAHLAQRFLGRRYRAADFRKPAQETAGSRSFTFSGGGTVLVNEHGKQNVVVIGTGTYWQNIDVFDREAAKVRPPTPNH